MAVAPLVLLPFAGERTTATVLLWLSAFGFIWVLMEPSRRKGEMPHDARLRVGISVRSDPLFWFSLVLVAYAVVRTANGGIGLSYDAEFMTWTIRRPPMPLLPGCVAGAGYFPLSVIVALAVLFQGVRHALGRSARAAFLLVSSAASGIAAIVFAVALSYDHGGVLAFAGYSTLSATYFGTAFGIQFLCALVALLDSVMCQWVRAEPVAVLGLVGNAIGFSLFAPVHTFVVFVVAFLILVVASFAMLRHAIEKSSSFRCALAVMLAVAALVIYAISISELPTMAAKIAAVKSCKPFADGFMAQRDALSSIALTTWKGSPWLGTGLDTFPLDIRFIATAADWTVVAPAQKTALCGWWQLLAERGVIGAAMIAVTLGMLIWTFVLRIVKSFKTLHFSPEHLLGPVVLLALVALAFVDCSFLRPDVLLLSGTLIAFSGGALPSPQKSSGEGKEI